MNTDALRRQPHAVLDLPSRRHKGLKIERLLDLRNRKQPFSLLEIGTGSGGIAHYFATHPDLQCKVTAVDVVDQRLVREGYDFEKVRDTALPFAAASFDVVLSNHVIEHVGKCAVQLRHLAEIQRVMKPDGVGYLAVPNRWMLVEPHYRLAFLSWLPCGLRSPYVRLFRRGDEYDCNPPSQRTLEDLLRTSGLVCEYLGTRALHEVIAIEGRTGVLASFIEALPDAWLDRLAAFNPTLIYRLEVGHA